MHKEILLINSDNTRITYETILDFQSRDAYKNTIFWVNQCPRGEYQSGDELMDRATHLLRLVSKVSQVFVLKAGGKVSIFDNVTKAVINIANASNVPIVYYIDEEVSSV